MPFKGDAGRGLWCEGHFFPLFHGGVRCRTRSDRNSVGPEVMSTRAVRASVREVRLRGPSREEPGGKLRAWETLIYPYRD